MASETNGSGKSMELWKFISGALLAVVLLGMGGVIGRIASTSISRDEMTVLVKRADESHDRFQATDNDHEARLRLLETAVLELTAIRRELEGDNNNR